MDEIINLASMDRNPVQDDQFRKLLEAQGIAYTKDGGRTNVTGFGFGGNNARSTAESFFNPNRIAADKLQSENKAAQSDFLSRYSTEVPAAIDAAEQALGLPGLRTIATRENNLLEDIPEIQTTAARGRDINANQLQRIIAADTQEQAPIAQRATQNVLGAEGVLQSRVGQILSPYEIEAGFLGENVRNAVDLFKTQMNADLTREIEKLRETGINNRDQLNRAIQLAEIEQGGWNAIDAGDRIEIRNSRTGEIMNSILKGLTPSRGSSVSASSGW